MSHFCDNLRKADASYPLRWQNERHFDDIPYACAPLLDISLKLDFASTLYTFLNEKLFQLFPPVWEINNSPSAVSKDLKWNIN